MTSIVRAGCVHATAAKQCYHDTNGVVTAPRALPSDFLERALSKVKFVLPEDRKAALRSVLKRAHDEQTDAVFPGACGSDCVISMLAVLLLVVVITHALCTGHTHVDVDVLQITKKIPPSFPSCTDAPIM